MIKARAVVDLTPAEGLTKAGFGKALRVGVSRAASPAKAAAVRHAEGVRRFGFLAKSIRIRLRSYPSDRWVAVIGPSTKYVRKKGKFTRGKRKGQPRVSKPSKYAHLVEGGTTHSRAKPWLKPAYQESAPRFLATVSAEIGREIQTELARRAAAKGSKQ